jgi:hypothetical protein
MIIELDYPPTNFFTESSRTRRANFFKSIYHIRPIKAEKANLLVSVSQKSSKNFVLFNKKNKYYTHDELKEILQQAFIYTWLKNTQILSWTFIDVQPQPHPRIIIEVRPSHEINI